MHISDNTDFGTNSRWSAISQTTNEQRDLLKDSLLCPALTKYSIIHTGLMEADSDYQLYRYHQSGSFLLACTDGEGEFLIDGGWRSVSAGQACLLPPYMTNAFRSKSTSPWKFAWVRYAEKEHNKAIANSHSPTWGTYPSDSLAHTITGLLQELQTENNATVVSHWVDLLHQQVLRYAKPSELDSRLVQIWQTVCSELSHDWTLSALAAIGHISEEHLRRLNNKQLGRSPMQHLIYLRMLKARQLLLESDLTVEAITHEVGYTNAFTFSNTFKKWMGSRPSSLR